MRVGVDLSADLSAVNIWAEIIFIWSLEYHSPKLKSRFNSQNINLRIRNQIKFSNQIVHREKMFEFEIKSPVGKVSKKLLQRYQARDLHGYIGFILVSLS